MRKIIVSEFITLNGVVEDPGGSDGFKYGGWSLDSFSEEYGKYKFDEIFACDALLLGRKTYEGFAAAWPEYEKNGDDSGFAQRMNSLPKYVVSTSLEKLSWNNSHLINGNLSEEIKKLKNEPGQDILVAGSVQLINTLSALNLIDEYRLMVHPVVLGSGKHLFTNDAKLKLKLLESKVFSSGIVVLHYGVPVD